MPGDAVYTALITGGTAVFTGFISSIAARSQHAVERRRLQHEYAAGTSNQVQFRQDLYLRYLAAFDGVRLGRVFTHPDTVTLDEYTKVYNAVREIDDQIEIFATAGVADAREACWAAVTALHSRITGLLEERLAELEAGATGGQLTDDSPPADTQSGVESEPPSESDDDRTFGDIAVAEALATALDDTREAFVAARANLIRAMREDVGPTSK